METTFCRSNLADRQGKYLQEIGGDIFFIGGRAHKPRVSRRSGYVIEIYLEHPIRNIRFDRVYHTDTQSFRMFVEETTIDLEEGFALANEHRNTPSTVLRENVGRISKGAKEKETGASTSRGKIRGEQTFLDARQKTNGCRSFSPSDGCVSPTLVPPFSHRFFRTWLGNQLVSSGKKHDLYRISEDSF